MQRLMSVGIVSFAKVMGLASLLMSLVIAIPYGIIMILFGVVGGAASSDSGGAGIAALGVGGGIAVMIVVPLVYGAFGFIFGLIYGLILNLVLGWAGGLELEIHGPTLANKSL